MPFRLEGLESRRLFSAGAQPFGAGANGIPSNWVSSFADDFDGTSLDSSKWFIRDRVRNNTTQPHDPRPNYTTPDAVSVGGGNLKLTVFSTPDYHMSGWIETKRKDTDGVITGDVNDTRFEQSYGYWEARLKISDGLPGAWGGFWVHSYLMENTTAPANLIGTEMDVVEAGKWGGYGNYSTVKPTVHWNGYSNPRSLGSETPIPNGGFATDFHVYGLKWSTTAIQFYIDGVNTFTVTDPAAISTLRQSIILSNHTGAFYGWVGAQPAEGYGTVNSSINYLTIDYVKVWSDPTAPAPRTTSAVTGTAYIDRNANGVRDRLDTPLYGRTVYGDLNNNGQLDADEPTGLSDADGNYRIPLMPMGNVTVRQVLPAGWYQAQANPVVFLNGSTVANLAFGSHSAATSPDVIANGAPTTTRLARTRPVERPVVTILG